VRPVGAVIGAVAGGIASGVGVAAVDRVDNDNTVSGLGDGATTDAERTLTEPRRHEQRFTSRWQRCEQRH
jgi:hypothetical protein